MDPIDSDGIAVDQQPDADMDEQLHEMTASYSEISFDSDESDKEITAPILQSITCKMNLKKSRPDSLEFSNKDVKESALDFLHDAGTVEQDGDMVLFFSQDLETKIKLASPILKPESPMIPQEASRSSTPCLYRQALTPSLPPLDPTVLNALEAEARKVATAVDSLTENLAGLLHSVSALTVDCLETYRDAVCSTCDAVDSNIKSMYQLMAKCEELSKSIKPVYKLAEQIKEIKRLLDLYESSVNI